MLMEESAVQRKNAHTPIEVSPSGRTMEESAVQPQNAHAPIEVSPLGRTTEESAVQPLNAHSLIEVSPVGRTTEESAVQLKNALQRMIFTPAFMWTLVIISLLRSLSLTTVPSIIICSPSYVACIVLSLSHSSFSPFFTIAGNDTWIPTQRNERLSRPHTLPRQERHHKPDKQTQIL